jgi:predicted metal-dependent peptidase
MKHHDSVMEQRIGAARAQLVLQHPFLGALLLKLPMREDNRCRSIATDGTEIYYRAEFFKALSSADIQFHLIHQVLHCALGHPWRRGHRLSVPWDTACDYAVNQLLVDEGFKLAPGAIVDDRFRGLSAEEIYPLLNFADSRHTLDDHSWYSPPRFAIGRPAATANSAKTIDIDDHPRESLDADKKSASDAAENWQATVTHMAQRMRGKGRLSASLQRALDAVRQPVLPWQVLLARFLASHARDDYSFHRISRRGGDALLPSLHSEQTKLVIAIDNSGSIGEAELDEFIAEIDALKSQMRAAITLLACDVALHAGCPWYFAATDVLHVPESWSGGGGTRFTPVFHWVAREGQAPDALIYFTDAMGEFPAHEPAYPVLWLVKGRGKVPWGTRIQLN